MRCARAARIPHPTSAVLLCWFADVLVSPSPTLPLFLRALCVLCVSNSSGRPAPRAPPTPRGTRLAPRGGLRLHLPLGESHRPRARSAAHTPAEGRLYGRDTYSPRGGSWARGRTGCIGRVPSTGV